MFTPNAIYEIPETLQKYIEKSTRQRLRIQQKLRSGKIKEIQNIKLIFVEIKIDAEDAKLIADEIQESQSDDKYFRVSLENIKFTVNMAESDGI